MMKYLGELKALLQGQENLYEDEDLLKALEGKGAIKCRFVPNWSLRKNQTCKRAFQCSFRKNYPQDPRCPLQLVKIAGEVLKKHWLEEIEGF